MGIEGKVLDEEVPGRKARNIDFFTHFKKDHPDQMVMLHYNGRSHDPNSDTQSFFAGHWAYHNGAIILTDLPAQAGEMDIRVNDASLFRVNIGRYQNTNEDIGLCELDPQGKPNWMNSEQVQLISINIPEKTIRVRRGAYGTAPRAFKVNNGYAAAHVSEGPWGKKSNLLWSYNFASSCPRDGKGHNCSDVLVAYLANLFASGGELENFDGLEFDVLMDTIGGNPLAKRSPDLNADGKPDAGIINGVNEYAIGVIEFCRNLTDQMSGKLVLADGWEQDNQRAFETLNGIESEGWPQLRDPQVNDWSGGLNRQLFWLANSRSPKLTYINHKFQTDDNDFNPSAPIPYSIHRLVFAGAVFTDSAICSSLLPPKEPGELTSIWDEWWQGTDKKTGWLGKPLAPVVHIAEKMKNIFEGQDLLMFFKGEGVNFENDGAAIKITAINNDSSDMQFRLSEIPTIASDLHFVFEAHAAPLPHYPAERARLIQLSIDKSQSYAWVNQNVFSYRFDYSPVSNETVDLNLTVEGNTPIWISRVAGFNSSDTCYREFENGLVLANPSLHSVNFNLKDLFPGVLWRHIKGSSLQDANTNNGEQVGDLLQLSGRDALFLLKIK